MIDSKTLEIVLLSVVAIVGLMALSLVFALRGRKDEFIALTEQLFNGVLKITDARLAAFGPVLQPLHATLEVAEGLADESSDKLIQTLAAAFKVQPEVVIATLKPLFDNALALTDGVSATSAAATGQPSGVTVAYLQPDITGDVKSQVIGAVRQAIDEVAGAPGLGGAVR